MNVRVISLLLAHFFAAAAPAGAETFGFEISLDAGRDSTEFTAPIFVIGPVPDPPPSLTIDTDTDTIAIAGRWFFDAVDDTGAPRSRAAFASRASFMSLQYRSSDASAEADFDAILLPPPGVFPVPPPGGPIVIEPEPVSIAPVPAVETSEFTIGGRYIWADTGWYAFGSAAFGEGEVNGFPDSDVDTTSFLAGAGYYVGRLTSLDLSVISTDVDDNTFIDDSATDVAINLRHIGDVNADWQFGVDAGLVLRDNVDDTIALRGALYPNRDVSFGLGIETTTDDFLSDGSRYTLFGGWFITPGVELSARFNKDDLPSPVGGSVDSDGFALALLARF